MLKILIADNNVGLCETLNASWTAGRNAGGVYCP